MYTCNRCCWIWGESCTCIDLDTARREQEKDASYIWEKCAPYYQPRQRLALYIHATGVATLNDRLASWLTILSRPQKHVYAQPPICVCVCTNLTRIALILLQAMHILMQASIFIQAIKPRLRLMIQVHMQHCLLLYGLGWCRWYTESPSRVIHVDSLQITRSPPATPSSPRDLQNLHVYKGIDSPSDSLRGFDFTVECNTVCCMSATKEWQLLKSGKRTQLSPLFALCFLLLYTLYLSLCTLFSALFHNTIGCYEA